MHGYRRSARRKIKVQVFDTWTCKLHGENVEFGTGKLSDGNCYPSPTFVSGVRVFSIDWEIGIQFAISTIFPWQSFFNPRTFVSPRRS